MKVDIEIYSIENFLNVLIYHSESDHEKVKILLKRAG